MVDIYSWLMCADVFKHCCKTSLMTCIIIILSFIEFKGIAFLLNGVVGQMHE